MTTLSFSLALLLSLTLPMSAKALAGSQQEKQVNTSAAQATSKQQEAQSKSAPQEVSADRIEELFRFLAEHHPEIRPLLRSLQKNQKQQFDSAMRTLDKEVRALQIQKERAPDRYERSLQMWIARSKTKLIAAQLAVSKNENQRKQMQQVMERLLKRHSQLREQQIVADIKSLEERVARLRKQRQDLQKNRDSDIQRQIDALTRSAQRMQKARDKQTGKDKKPAKSGGE